MYLPVYLPAHLSTFLSTYLPFILHPCILACLSTYLSSFLPTCLFFYHTTYRPYLSFCMYLFMLFLFNNCTLPASVNVGVWESGNFSFSFFNFVFFFFFFSFFLFSFFLMRGSGGSHKGKCFSQVLNFKNFFFPPQIIFPFARNSKFHPKKKLAFFYANLLS